VADDAHRLRPDHHPTPFSAAEIQAAFVPGQILKTRIVRAGADPVIFVRRNVSADAEGGDYEVWTEAADGTVLSEPEQGRSTWIELQGHASMPIDATTIEPTTIDVPIGRFEGQRYTRVDGDTVDVFLFALALPGAPVHVEKRVNGELVSSATAIETIPG